MHELSLTLALLDEIDTVARRERATSVIAVRVNVGSNSGVSCEALRFAWDVARIDTIAATADLQLNRIEGRAFDLVGLDVR